MILEFSINDQLFCCLICVTVGCAFGILYDALRVIYMLLGCDPHDKQKRGLIYKIPVFILDLAYMTAVCAFYAAVMYAFAYGKFRLIFGICTLTGFIVYNRTLSRLVIFLLRRIVAVLKMSVIYITGILLQPIRSVLKCLKLTVVLLYSVSIKVLLCHIKVRLDILHYNNLCGKNIETLISFTDTTDNLK